ncbi:hypothetical protein [Pelomonas sp. Root1217]|uniref:hypothetical protein n=1 Tax=Pelomonas sp. Root1217 TaxID=1736430 RepID=UPI000ABCB315|nr:hypothetical protein [Pelomonas sp. Root1217]
MSLILQVSCVDWSHRAEDCMKPARTAPQNFRFQASRRWRHFMAKFTPWDNPMG